MEELYLKVKDIESKAVKTYYKNRDIVSVDDLVNTVDDLLYEIEYLKEQLEDKR